MSIRVLVVDDSAVMRSLLRMVLARLPEVELAGMAADGVEALAMIEQLRPDLILLDVEMPRMNGLEVLAELRARGGKKKIIMCSTLTRRGAGITIEALASGATDYVTKPSGQNGAADALETLAAQLVPKIYALCTPRPAALHAAPPQPAAERMPASALKVVVIGVSTGGPAALEVLLPALPGDFPLPILLVQHMPQVFTALLAERLNNLCALEVREAAPTAAPAPGVVYIARGDWHLEVVAPAFASMATQSKSPRLRLTQTAPLQHCRPSVDVLFHSAVQVYGSGVIAAVLTGMGSDGLAGCRAVRAGGGMVLAQDQATSAVWGMPGVVAEAGLAQRVLPLGAMAAELLRLADYRPRPNSWAMSGLNGAMGANA